MTIEQIYLVCYMVSAVTAIYLLEYIVSYSFNKKVRKALTNGNNIRVLNSMSVVIDGVDGVLFIGRPDSRCFGYLMTSKYKAKLNSSNRALLLHKLKNYNHLPSF